MPERRRLIFFLLALAFAAPGAARLAAQITAADSAGLLYQTAVRLEAQGERAAAHALLRHLVRQYPGTPAAADAEQRLTQLTRHVIERSGRGELMVWYTIYGAWLGIAVPSALGADGPEPYGLGLLLGAPTGFLVSRAYGRSTPLSSGQARIIDFGSQWGTWQGLGWRAALDIGQRTETYCPPPPPGGVEQCYFYESRSDRAPWAAMLVGGIGGAVGAALLARGREIPGGAATFAIHSAYWGTWYGLASSVFADVHDSDAGLAWTLVGGNVGLLAGALAGPRGISSGRVWLITAGGLGGAAAGFGLDLLIQPDSDQLAIGIPTVTSALGLVLAAQWTRAYDAEGGGDGDDPPGMALLNVRSGRLSLGLPAIAPAPLELGGGGQPGYVWRVPVLEFRH